MMTPEEQAAALDHMHVASEHFYQASIRIGNHPFIEFTGLLNEYIKLCEQAHKEGIDFSDCNIHTGQALPVPDHSRAYMQEKLECIFGVSVQVSHHGNPDPTHPPS